ncbi:hypothetical protein DTX79_18580, partial [Bacilli bacterium]
MCVCVPVSVNETPTPELDSLALPVALPISWRDTLRHIAQLGWQVEIHREAVDLPQVLEPLLELGMKVVVDHFGRVDPALGV